MSMLNHDCLIEIMFHLRAIETRTPSDFRAPSDSWTRIPLANPDLCAAAQTCRSWLTPANMQIYQTVYFEPATSTFIPGITTIAHLLQIIHRHGTHIKKIVWWDPRLDTFTSEASEWHGFDIQDDDSNEDINILPRSLASDQRAKCNQLSLESLKELTELTEIHHITHTMLIRPFWYPGSRDPVRVFLSMLQRVPGISCHFAHLSWDLCDYNEDDAQLWAELLQRLPSLSYIQISALGYASPHFRSLFTHSMDTSGILKLELSLCLFPSNHELCTLLAAFKQLNRLVLDRVTLNSATILNAGSNHPILGMIAPPLRYISVQDRLHQFSPSLSLILHWLGEQPDVVSLEHLEIGYHVGVHSTWCGALALYSRTLKTLICHIEDIPLDLSKFCVLSHLTLTVRCAVMLQGHPQPLPLSNLIATLNSVSDVGCLNEVHLSLSDSPSVIEIDQWELLRACLDRPAFRKLQQLFIYLIFSKIQHDQTREVQERAMLLSYIHGFRCEIEYEHDPMPRASSSTQVLVVTVARPRFKWLRRIKELCYWLCF